MPDQLIVCIQFTLKLVNWACPCKLLLFCNNQNVIVGLKLQCMSKLQGSSFKWFEYPQDPNASSCDAGGHFPVQILLDGISAFSVFPLGCCLDAAVKC